WDGAVAAGPRYELRERGQEPNVERRPAGDQLRVREGGEQPGRGRRVPIEDRVRDADLERAVGVRDRDLAQVVASGERRCPLVAAARGHAGVVGLTTRAH